jgi:hypothetical protein
MIATPESIRSEREDTAKHAERIVCAAALKERVMSTIVLDDEQTHQQARRWNS